MQPIIRCSGGEWSMVASDRGDVLHWIPAHDTQPHLATHRCWCEPEAGLNIDAWIHNSADGREAYERGERRRH